MALVRKSDATRVLPVLGMLVECNVAGEGWQELKGASLVDHTAGSRSVNQVATLRGPGATVGAKTIENVTFDLAAVNPGLKIMDDLHRADEQQLNVSVRMSIYSRVIRAPTATPAVTATITAPSDVANSIVTTDIGGKVAFAAGDGKDEIEAMFDANEIMVSDLLSIGATVTDGTTFIVNAILVDDTTDSIARGAAGTSATRGVYVTRITREAVAAVTSAVAVGARTAGWRQRFAGLVNQFGSIQGDASGSPSLSSGVVFTPHALLARPTILRLNEGGE